ncbi:MAG: AAA family ATPase [Candidatus Paceibacterota bacterium]|jgi:ATP-dependent 26S proteasome regulatory subunit
MILNIPDFEKHLITYIKAKTPILQIISFETLRIHAALNYAADLSSRKLYVWNRTEGLAQYDIKTGILNTEDTSLREPGEILEWFSEEDQQNIILLLEDFHPDIAENQPQTINRLRCISRKISLQQLDNRILILSQPIHYLPIELEKEVQILELPLPSKEDLRKIILAIKKQFNLDDRDCEEDSARLLDAALGLSTTEAWSAFATVAVEKERITELEIPLIAAEKEQVIRKRGHLEFYQPENNLDDIGGLGRLKEWLKRRQKAFTQDARDFGLEVPRGILLLGLPGTGKSLAAKAVANAWQLPLLKLDMGKIFGGIVGQSEENIRFALSTAETLAPCILWIDEIEKGMAGLQSSGATDGGTTSRVLGTFLTWMQEKKKPVFVVATANNIAQLPPELLRKGRLDEIFFADLPDALDRKEILKIHLLRRKRKPFSEEQMNELATLSKGFTGAELEEAIKEAMYRAYDEEHDLSAADVKAAILETSPLSKTMSEVIRNTREWAKGRAVPASDRAPEDLEVSSDTKKKPVLPQEIANPFSWK